MIIVIILLILFAYFLTFSCLGYIFRPRPQNAFDIIDEKAGGGVFAKYEIG